MVGWVAEVAVEQGRGRVGTRRRKCNAGRSKRRHTWRRSRGVLRLGVSEVACMTNQPSV